MVDGIDHRELEVIEGMDHWKQWKELAVWHEKCKWKEIERNGKWSWNLEIQTLITDDDVNYIIQKRFLSLL